MKSDRYAVEWNKAYSCWYVEDTWTGDDVADCGERGDADIICECLNVIEYDRVIGYTKVETE